jgi:hypothetical protein
MSRDWRSRLRWFLAEFLVVVTGVLVALALNAWWQQRRDAGREEAYLRQLVADLQESERRFAEADQRVAFADEGRTRLLHAFWAPDASPRDSVLYWADVSAYYEDPRSVMGTVTALLSTGDLNLVRDDSIRSAITGFAEAEARYAELNRNNVQVMLANSRRIWERLDVLEGTFNIVSRARMDSMARARDVWYYPPGAERSAFSNDVPAFLRGREAYGIVMSLFDAGADMKRSRWRRLEDVRALRAQIEAAVDDVDRRSWVIPLEENEYRELKDSAPDGRSSQEARGG